MILIFKRKSIIQIFLYLIFIYKYAMRKRKVEKNYLMKCVDLLKQQQTKHQ